MILSRALFVGFAIWCVASYFAPYDDTDFPGSRSGLSVKTDARTGCQYLTTAFGGIVPRLNADGFQLGCRKDAG